MKSILENVTQSDIIRDPFPHVVIKNALSQELIDQLLSEYPSAEYLGQGRQGLTKNAKMPNNIKLRYNSADVLGDDKLPAVWKEFVRTHLTYEFFSKYLDIFKEDVYSLYPKFGRFLDNLSKEDVGVKLIDTYEDKKVLLNAEICADTPVKEVSSVRKIHLDHAQKLGVALLYLKRKDDNSEGGNFEIYKHTNDRKYIINHIRNIKDRYTQDFTKIKEVTYEHNTLVIFLNSPKSFHAVSVRQPTNHLRYVFDIAFEVGFPLFDISKHAENKWITRFRARYMRLLGLHKEMV